MLFDGHTHFISALMLRKISERFARLDPGLAERSLSSKIHSKAFLNYLQTPIEEMAKSWRAELQSGGVEGSLFIPISDDIEGFSSFLSFFPENFFGLSFLDNPLEKNAPDLLDSHVNNYGMKGLKLYPPVQGFHAYDRQLYPLYEKAAELDIPILFHFGISTSPFFDFRFANPLDLKVPLTLFPDLKFVIAHFGAGFFREVLMLAYHTQNIFVDTSGTNNWREYLPSVMPLKQIFKRAFDVYGTERVIFGTDSVVSAHGYRQAIKDEQINILESLGLTSSAVDNVLGKNILRILK